MQDMLIILRLSDDAHSQVSKFVIIAVRVERTQSRSISVFCHIHTSAFDPGTVCSRNDLKS
jgi:hypothetical protein